MSDRIAIVGIVLVGCLAALLLALVTRRHWRSFRARLRAARASDGERRAESLLARRGFRVVDRQRRISWSVSCDDSSVPVNLRVDLVARRWGRTYIAEVKTGAEAPSLTNSATRRQLLEYKAASDADGVLLVDAEKNKVHHIRFGLRRRRGFVPLWVVCAAVAGYALGHLQPLGL